MDQSEDPKIVALRNEMRREVAKAHASYPQYAGHWDNHVLVRIERDWETKMGVSFVHDEIALAAPALTRVEDCPEDLYYRIVYSARTRCNTAVEIEDVYDLRPGDLDNHDLSRTQPRA